MPDTSIETPAAQPQRYQEVGATGRTYNLTAAEHRLKDGAQVAMGLGLAALDMYANSDIPESSSFVGKVMEHSLIIAGGFIATQGVCKYLQHRKLK
jgi:hypothetical protein